MSAEDLLEAGVLIYLRGLGFPTERKPPDPTGASAKPSPPSPPPGPWGHKSAT
jgi:hypothetical protein